MRKSRIVLGILAIVLSISCSDKNPIVADGIFDGDKMDVIKDSIVGLDIEAFSISNANAFTSPVTNGLVGVHNDDIFGKTKAGTAFQFRLPGRFYFEEEASNGVQKTIDDMNVDSAFIYLTYDQVYFDSTKVQNINVYRINGGLNVAESYRANEKDKLDLGDLLAEKDFNFEILADTIITRDTTIYDTKSKINPEQDSMLIVIDTNVSPSLKIALDNEVARNIFMTPEAESNYDSQASFLSYFKGIYVDVDDFSDGGAIFAFNISNGKQLTTSYVDKSRIDMYYSYEETLKDKDDQDSIVTRPRYFRIATNENSARVNFIEHDFTGSEIDGKIGDKNDIAENEKVYIKGAAGTMAKLYIEDINNWCDSTDIAINSAVLTLKGDKDSTYYNTNAPSELGLAVYNEENGEIAEEPVIIGQSKYSKYTNGYAFDLSLYLQTIIQRQGELKNKSIIVYSVNRSEDPRGIAIANPKIQGIEDKRIKLSITYTKIK